MSSVQEMLRECNSFYNNNESDPWEMHFPVIPSINGDTFTTIISILKNCIKYPSQNTGIIIFGEAGFGKTHMIGRVRKHCETSDISAFFSNIRPIIDERSSMRHLIKGIITSLAHDIEGTPGYTQIHKLISEIIVDYYRQLVKDNKKEQKKLDIILEKRDFFFKPYRDRISKADILKDKVITWISDKNCSINPYFVRLLFSFCNPNLHNIAFQRLIGNIADKEDAEKLGVPFRENMSESALEEEAREFVISLGFILADYHHILVVCFDQLENLQKKEQVNAFGLMILTLINECKAMLPLAMSRTLHWNDVIQPDLERSVVERITCNNFTLFGCNEEEIQEILKTRIRACLDDQWEEAYHWLFDKLNDKLTPNPSPREVISLANQVIKQGEPAIDKGSSIKPEFSEPNGVISNAYLNERDQILSDMTSWPPDYEELTETITLYYSSRGFDVKREKRTHKAILKISGEGKRCSIIINTNSNHSTIGACFAYGTEYLLKNPGQSCLYLTDPRCIVTKPNWKQTNEKKNEYLSAGGEICHPSEGDIAWYYALYSLNCKITEGDLLIETETGIRSITRGELVSYIGDKALFSLPFRTSQTESTDKKKKREKLSDDPIHAALCKILLNAPMHGMKSTIITDKLNFLDISITHDDLLIWCGEHKESYVIFRSPKGSTIMLKELDAICSK